MYSLDFGRFMFALDYVYFMCDELTANERKTLIVAIDAVIKYIDQRFKHDGEFLEEYNSPAIEVIRRRLFAINCLEDIIQDCAVTWGMPFAPIEKIFQTVPNIELMARHIKAAKSQP